MAGLPEPYIPDINRTLANYNTGYALGQDQRKQNALTQAGEFMAKNDQTGARNALYQGGQMAEGLQIDDRMRAAARQAKDDQLAKAKRSNEVIGNLAMLADTPEKWAVAIGTAKKAGLAVDNWMDFGTRDYVLAQGGKVNEFLDLELKRRALEAKGDPIAVVSKGGRIFDKQTRQYIDQPGVDADPEFTLEQGKHEQSLRKEYTSLSADMRVIQDGVAKMQKASTLDSGPGDMAMVYSYMKMLDPTSVVREGEYATAENTGGVPEKIWGLYNRARTGERLTPNQRAEFLDAGGALASEKGQRFGKLRGQFENIARRSGADPQRILLDEGMAQSPQDNARGGSAPQPGQVEDGYRFKGGNPADPNSWEKI